jgi:transmembrane sensor
MVRHPSSANEPDAQDGRNEAIVEAAAEWRARIDGGMTPEEETRFAAWLEADPRHTEIFTEFEQTWEILDRVTELPGRKPAEAAASMVPIAAPRVRRWPMWAGIAAAASVAIAIGWRTLPRSEQFAAAVAAEPGMMKRVNLPDGSVIRLNSDSVVAVEFSNRERHITLQQGEAHFTVAKDPKHPFVVTTAGIEVRAVGTVFNVVRNAKAVEVLVTEGAVRVADPARGASLLATPVAADAAPSTPALAAGEKVVIAMTPSAPAPATPVSVPADEIAQALAWQDRRLQFNSTPLSEIANEFNRFNAQQLQVEDSPLARQGFSGSFRADDPETFVKLIETRPGVTVERKPGRTVIRLAK